MERVVKCPYVHDLSRHYTITSTYKGSYTSALPYVERLEFHLPLHTTYWNLFASIVRRPVRNRRSIKVGSVLASIRFGLHYLGSGTLTTRKTPSRFRGRLTAGRCGSKMELK